jgi:hypothetical protein
MTCKSGCASIISRANSRQGLKSSTTRMRCIRFPLSANEMYRVECDLYAGVLLMSQRTMRLTWPDKNLNGHKTRSPQERLVRTRGPDAVAIRPTCGISIARFSENDLSSGYLIWRVAEKSRGALEDSTGTFPSGLFSLVDAQMASSMATALRP